VEGRDLFSWDPDGEPHPVRNRKNRPMRRPRKTRRKCLAFIMRRPDGLFIRLNFVSRRTNSIEIFESWEKVPEKIYVTVGTYLYVKASVILDEKR
jgi:hypothetical protein